MAQTMPRMMVARNNWATIVLRRARQHELAIIDDARGFFPGMAVVGSCI